MKAAHRINQPPPIWKRLLEYLLESRPIGWAFDCWWLWRHRKSFPSFASHPLRSREITIEVTNICNADCVFCGYQFRQRPAGVMPFELFRKIVDQYAAIGGGMIELTPVVGEALVDPGLEQKIHYARSRPEIGRISLITNGILLTRQRFESLAAAGVTHLSISISGLNRAEHEAIFRVRHYDKLMANLVDIAASPAFARVAIALGIRSDSLRAWRRSPDLQKLVALGYREFGSTLLFDNWNGRIRTANLPGLMMVRPRRSKTAPCWMLYNSTTVLVDGQMTACGCRDLDGTSELALGSIKDQPLDAPWKDGRMEALRRRFREDNLPDVCRDCRHYVPAREINETKPATGTSLST